jgi:hypothetical protein
MHGDFAKDYKVVRGNAAPNTALANGNYPASGSYVDLTGYEWVNISVALGTIADALTFEIKQTDGTAGATLDTISTTLAKKTIATLDDGQNLNFYIQTANLATDHHFITCVVGAVSGNNYAAIQYFLGGARVQPVTQATAVMPTDNTFQFAG